MQYELTMEVYDEDLITKDDLIGKQKISLLPYFKRGYVEEWIPIHNKARGWGGEENAGEILIRWDFKGPKGVSYPQRQPLVDSFDDSERIDKDALEQAELDEAEEEEAEREAKKDNEVDEEYGVTDEFSDKEIFDAFRFMDLDKNMYVPCGSLQAPQAVLLHPRDHPPHARIGDATPRSPPLMRLGNTHPSPVRLSGSLAWRR